MPSKLDKLMPVVDPAITRGFKDSVHWRDTAKGDTDAFLYSRNHHNKAEESVIRALVALEGAAFGTTVSSGLAAINTLFFALLKPGSTVLVTRDTYGGTQYLLQTVLRKWGVTVKLVECNSSAAIIDALDDSIDLLYLETPSNPLLKMQDIAVLSEAAKRVGALVAVDSTVATPIVQTPLKLGADFVIHSLTKFIGGHADAMGGIILCADSKYANALTAGRETSGCQMDPHSAYLIARGIRTLELRMKQHCDNAYQLAHWLDEHAAVKQVYYPGLSDHPQHQLAQQQMTSFGPLLSFSLHSANQVNEFIEGLEVATMASTLGSVETLIGLPETTSHVECTEEERQALGVPAGLVRVSVGVEPIALLIEDFAQALAK